MPRDIPTHLWVAALTRRAELRGAFVAIVRKGDAERGDVLVKVTPTRGRAQLYAQAYTSDEPPRFERLFPDVDAADEADADAMIARRVRADPDLWVIEIDDRDGRHFLVEAVK